MALAALLGADVHFHSWRYFGELKKLQPRRASPLFLEALIATCVVGRIRPSRTVRSMKELRALRDAAGEQAQFVRFETQLKAFLGANALSNHELGRQTFSGLDHTGIWAQVAAHITALRGLGYEVFLNSGTLLGVTRDKKLIDHDDDIDLAVILKAHGPGAAAAEWRQLKQTLSSAGLLDEQNTTDPAIYKLKTHEGCEIDLFPAWSDGKRMFVFPHTFGELADEDVLPLGRCSVSGQPVPALPEKMLGVNYGASWRKPDPYFKFNWVRARRSFAEFLEALK